MSRDPSMIDEFAMDVVYGPRRRERVAYGVAALGVVVGLMGLGGALSLLPLKTTETVVVVVDKATGEMDRVARVAPMTLAEEDAVIQAHLVAYVDDRETYDPHDSVARINAVLDRSDEDAAATLIALWSGSNEEHPRRVYGDDARIHVTVRSVTVIEPGVAQVRFAKTLRGLRDGTTVERAYTATVAYDWRPETEQTLGAVWANPLGFVVTGYRVDAETLEG